MFKLLGNSHLAFQFFFDEKDFTVKYKYTSPVTFDAEKARKKLIADNFDQTKVSEMLIEWASSS